MNGKKQLDIYSMMIVMKYVQTYKDVVNIVMTNSKFEEIPKMFHFNPIPLSPKVIELFPKIETAHYYDKSETVYLKRCQQKEYWYGVSYSQAVSNPKIKYKNITIENGEDIRLLSKEMKDGKLVIPSNVCEIKVDLFDNLRHGDCHSVVFPDKITKLHSQIFRGCRLQSIVLPRLLSKFETIDFRNNHSLTHIVLPQNLLHIPRECFVGCGLTSIELPMFVKEINTMAFRNLPLRQITFNEGLTKLGAYAFYRCKQLNYIKLPSSLRIIEMGCFSECGLKSITIPSNVVSIGEDCFRGCPELRRVVLPRNFKGEGYMAFGDCPKIEQKIYGH